MKEGNGILLANSSNNDTCGNPASGGILARRVAQTHHNAFTDIPAAEDGGGEVWVDARKGNHGDVLLRKVGKTVEKVTKM